MVEEEEAKKVEEEEDVVDNDDTDEVVSDEEVEEGVLVPLLVVVTPTELLGELAFDDAVDELAEDRPEGLCWHFFPAETSRMRIATGNAWDQRSFMVLAVGSSQGPARTGKSSWNLADVHNPSRF
ncbi:hypothetical protein PG996_007472 [Apiospora saccharicola]|uniref:Uncharacterized protein n=1 Tax=Apiospora saccharicola TaxID=335842 RepID=A0ABR1VDP0_9PEZI